ncbi:MAG TPA: class I SAM-dependent methyltransferase, partial [Candidatus Manganitrophaceae bacterium]
MLTLSKHPGMSMPQTISPFNKEKAVQKMFSAIARFYDLNNTLLSFGLHHRWKERTLRAAALRPGEEVVDVGAGTADLSIKAAEQVGEKGKVVAVDLNELMLRIGRSKLQKKNGGRALCALGNA